MIDTDDVAFTNNQGNDYVAWDFDTDTNYLEDKDYLVQYYYIEDQLGETPVVLANTGFNLNYYGIAGVVSLLTGFVLFTSFRKKRLVSKEFPTNSLDPVYRNIYILKSKIESLVNEKVEILINFNKLNPYIERNLYTNNQDEIINTLNEEVLNLISSINNINDKSSDNSISQPELEKILKLIASEKIDFRFSEEVLVDDQVPKNAFNIDLPLNKTNTKKINRFYARALTGVSILLIATGLLFSGYAYNEMYLTNSKQVVAQEKLAAVFNGQENFENNEIVFASESSFIDLREIFNDTPIFDNLMEQVLPEENISLIDSEPEIFGYLEIENINVKQYVLSDTREDTLKLGPGHYNNTSLPGTGGNVGIAGHRTTYGAPFGDLDALQIGDRILLTVDSKTFHYQVDTIDIVSAVGGEYVLFDRGDDRLTLTTCHPKYSAKERLIVSGILTKIEVIG